MPRFQTKFAVGLLLGFLVSSSAVWAEDPAALAVGPQYDTTHVYVAPEEFDRFVASFAATFGGTTSKQGVFQVTPTPSKTMSQLVLTPAGTVSVFGFKTPVPYPFGVERSGFLVSDFDRAVNTARADGADVLVSPFPDPIGRDAIIQWPGGVTMQLYWHTTAPSYAELATIPESRIYVSPDRADAFAQDFVAFSHGKIVSDNENAPGIEVGKSGETIRRIRIESGFGKTAVFVTDGHLPWPYGRELSGYEVSDLAATLNKATAAGANILVQPFASDGRESTMVQFPGGYIAEIHGPAWAGPHAFVAAPINEAVAGPVGDADLQNWASAWNSHDIDRVSALFAPEVVIHQPSNPQPLDLQGARHFFGMIFMAYPDFHIAVKEAVIDRLKAVSIEQVTGTWFGPFTDPATGATTDGNGRKFDHPGVMVITYRPDHKITNLDIYWDRLVVDQQLGIRP
jgi:steroid delta-isomerase-like uncharacterized protein